MGEKSNHHPLLFSLPFEGVSPGSVDFEEKLPSIFNPYPVNINVIYFLGLAYIKVHFRLDFIMNANTLSLILPYVLSKYISR